MTPRLLRPWPLTLSVLGLLLLSVLALEIAGWPFLRAPLEHQASARLQREVRLEGTFRLRLIGSLRLRVDALRIGAPAWERAAGGGPAAPFLQAGDVNLVLPYGSLLQQLRGGSEPLRIRRLEVGALEARLRRLADGRSNWAFPSPGQERKDSSAGTPEFVHLVVHKGQLTLEDATRDLTLAAQVRTREGSARDAAGLFVRASGRYQEQAFTVEARSPGLLPLLAPAGTGRAVALGISARLSHPGRRDSQLSFRGRARDLLRFEGLEGKFRIAGPSLADTGRMMKLTLPSTAPFFMQGEADKEGGTWDVHISRFDVAETRLNGKFRYRQDLPRPLLSGELHGEQLRLRDLAPALGASPPPPGTDAHDEAAGSSGGRILPRREFDLPALHRMDADVAVDIDRVDLGSRTLEPLHPLAGRLTLRDGVLRLDQLLARTAQGQLQGELQLDARESVPRWTGDLRWSGIALSDWVQARNPFAQAPGSGSAEARREERREGERRTPHFLTGELAGELKFAGTGRSTAAMLGSLDGRLHLWIRNGTVSHLLLEAIGLDIAEGLGLVIRGDRNLPLRCAAMSLKAEDGVLRTEAGVVDTPDTLVLLDGKVSLTDESFAIRLQARPHDRSLLSVRAPLRLRGTFAAPKVRPDLEKLAGKAALAAVLGALLSPLAALVPLVDPGEESAGRGCATTLATLRQKPGTPAAMKRALGGQQ